MTRQEFPVGQGNFNRPAGVKKDIGLYRILTLALDVPLPNCCWAAGPRRREDSAKSLATALPPP